MTIDRTIIAAVAAAFAGCLLAPSASLAQTKKTGTARFRLVPAQCPPGPCNASYTFQSGSVQIKWPKRAKRISEGKIGNINLKTIAIAGGSVGVVLPTSLTAQVSGTRVFGSDPTGDCAFADTVQTGSFGSSSVGCFDSSGSLRCNGDLFFDPAEDPACADVDMRVQDIAVSVTPDADAGVDTAVLARNGRAIIGEVDPLPLIESTSAGRHRLVQAYCTTGPCAPSYTFKTGLAKLKRVRYSNLSGLAQIGKLKIAKLKDGTDTAPAGIDVEVSGTSHYGSDPSADCPQAGSSVSEVIATGSLSCKPSGKCVGDLFLANLIDPNCTDVDWVIEDLDISVYEDGMAGIESSRIAINGKALLAE